LTVSPLSSSSGCDLYLDGISTDLLCACSYCLWLDACSPAAPFSPSPPALFIRLKAPFFFCFPPSLPFLFRHAVPLYALGIQHLGQNLQLSIFTLSPSRHRLRPFSTPYASYSFIFRFETLFFSLAPLSLLESLSFILKVSLLRKPT